MAEAYTNWDITEHLSNKEDARFYLEAAAEEDPGDGSLIRVAISDIARAQNMGKLPLETGVNPNDFHEALAKDGNPSFATVMEIARALGMQLRFTA